MDEINWHYIANILTAKYHQQNRMPSKTSVIYYDDINECFTTAYYNSEEKRLVVWAKSVYIDNTTEFIKDVIELVDDNTQTLLMAYILGGSKNMVKDLTYKLIEPFLHNELYYQHYMITLLNAKYYADGRLPFRSILGTDYFAIEKYNEGYDYIRWASKDETYNEREIMYHSSMFISEKELVKEIWHMIKDEHFAPDFIAKMLGGKDGS